VKCNAPINFWPHYLPGAVSEEGWGFDQANSKVQMPDRPDDQIPSVTLDPDKGLGGE